jgi:hypothetical protein
LAYFFELLLSGFCIIPKIGGMRFLFLFFKSDFLLIDVKVASSTLPRAQLPLSGRPD